MKRCFVIDFVSPMNDEQRAKNKERHILNFKPEFLIAIVNFILKVNFEELMT